MRRPPVAGEDAGVTVMPQRFQCPAIVLTARARRRVDGRADDRTQDFASGDHFGVPGGRVHAPPRDMGHPVAPDAHAAVTQLHHVGLGKAARQAQPPGEAAFRAMFKEMVETDTSAATGDCICRTPSSVAWSQQPYTVSGTQLTLQDGRTFDYCVTGAQLLYRETGSATEPGVFTLQRL